MAKTMKSFRLTTMTAIELQQLSDKIGISQGEIISILVYLASREQLSEVNFWEQIEVAKRL